MTSHVSRASVLDEAAALAGYAEALLDLPRAKVQLPEHLACWLPPHQAQVLTLTAACSEWHGMSASV